MDVRRYKGSVAGFSHEHVWFVFILGDSIPSYKEGCYTLTPCCWCCLDDGRMNRTGADSPPSLFTASERLQLRIHPESWRCFPVAVDHRNIALSLPPVATATAVGVLGTGVPRLDCLRRGLSGGPVQPIFINSSSRPSRRPKPCGAGDRKLPQVRTRQEGSRGGGEIKAGVPREVPVTQAMTTQARRAPACAVSLFPLWCKSGQAQAKVSGK